MSNQALFTIGHSNRSIKEFIEILQMHQITAIADVRSQPFSRHMPHFNRDQLKKKLLEYNIVYAFLGKELGARRSEPNCYIKGKARYELIEQTQLFQSGLERIRRGLDTYRIALMCAEKDPLECHRFILISKALKNEVQIQHIMSHNKLESHEETELRLLDLYGMQQSLFSEQNELLEDAYQKQANEIAYIDKSYTFSQEDNCADD